MENIILLYNPRAGNALFRQMLDFFLATFMQKNLEVRIFRSNEPGDMAVYLENCSFEKTKAIFIAGGDGSVHEVVNTLLKCHCQIPLGVIPTGTDNDFAKELGMPKDVQQAIVQLSKMKTVRRDIGEVNGCYFVYECAGGSMANVGASVSTDMKNSMGKSAYYIHGVKQLSRTRRMQIILRDGETVQEEEVVYFHIRLQGNGKLVFRGIPIGIDTILMPSKKIIRREITSLLLETAEPIITNLDGDVGPETPIHVKVHPNAMRFIVGA